MREPQVQFLSGHMGKLRPRQQPSPKSPQQCLGLGPWTFAPEQVGQVKTSFWWSPPSSTMRGHRTEPRVKVGPGWDALASGIRVHLPTSPQRDTALCPPNLAMAEARNTHGCKTHTDGGHALGKHFLVSALGLQSPDTYRRGGQVL